GVTSSSAAMAARVAASNPVSAKIRRAVSRSCGRWIVGGRPICKSTYIYKWALSSCRKEKRRARGPPPHTELWGRLEKNLRRKLIRARPNHRRGRLEARHRIQAGLRQFIGRRVVAVLGVPYSPYVRSIRQIEGFGDELHVVIAEDVNVARNPRID